MISKKFYKAFFIFILLLSACTPQQKQKPTVDFKVVEAVMQAQLKAWNQGSVDGFMLGYWHSDSLKFITQKGVRMGYDSVSANYKRHYNTPEKMGQLSFDNLQFYTLDSNAEIVQCTGQWHVMSNDVNGGSGIFSLLFKKINGEWKIIVDHTW